MISERYLYVLEEAMAIKQGRKSCEVILADLPEQYQKILSMFERESNSIIFNMELVDSVSEMEVIASLIHEGRHAYQWHQINNPTKAVESLATLAAWKAEFNNYNQPLKDEKQANYITQAIEIDAIAFTAIQINLIGEGRLVIPNEIKKQVEKRMAVIKAKEL